MGTDCIWDLMDNTWCKGLNPKSWRRKAIPAFFSLFHRSLFLPVRQGRGSAGWSRRAVCWNPGALRDQGKAWGGWREAACAGRGRWGVWWEARGCWGKRAGVKGEERRRWRQMSVGSCWRKTKALSCWVWPGWRGYSGNSGDLEDNKFTSYLP